MGGLRLRGKMTLSAMVLMRCDNCKLVFNDRHVLCPRCNNKLIFEKTSVYANFGDHGVSSFIYKLASGITIKAKGNAAFPLDKGVPYSTKLKK